MGLCMLTLPQVLMQLYVSQSPIVKQVFFLKWYQKKSELVERIIQLQLNCDPCYLCIENKPAAKLCVGIMSLFNGLVTF